MWNVLQKAKMPTRYGECMIYGYINKLNGEHHVALVMGDNYRWRTGSVQSTFGVPDRRCAWFSARCDCGQQYDAAMKMIAKKKAEAFCFICGRKAEELG